MRFLLVVLPLVFMAFLSLPLSAQTLTTPTIASCETEALGKRVNALSKSINQYDNEQEAIATRKVEAPADRRER